MKKDQIYRIIFFIFFIIFLLNALTNPKFLNKTIYFFAGLFGLTEGAMKSNAIYLFILELIVIIFIIIGVILSINSINKKRSYEPNKFMLKTSKILKRRADSFSNNAAKIYAGIILSFIFGTLLMLTGTLRTKENLFSFMISIIFLVYDILTKKMLPSRKIPKSS